MIGKAYGALVHVTAVYEKLLGRSCSPFTPFPSPSLSFVLLLLPRRRFLFDRRSPLLLYEKCRTGRRWLNLRMKEVSQHTFFENIMVYSRKEQCAVVLTNLIFVLFGLYVWEILITLDFEWSLISRTRKMSWPLVS